MVNWWVWASQFHHSQLVRHQLVRHRLVQRYGCRIIQRLLECGPPDQATARTAWRGPPWKVVLKGSPMYEQNKCIAYYWWYCNNTSLVIIIGDIVVFIWLLYNSIIIVYFWPWMIDFYWSSITIIIFVKNIQSIYNFPAENYFDHVFYKIL